jgi:monoamine oxidase
MQSGTATEKWDCAVVIIGAGPCGLMLAIELGRRGVSAVVLEEKSTPSRFPSANATQARTMEHYRRLASPTRCALGSGECVASPAGCWEEAVMKVCTSGSARIQ